MTGLSDRQRDAFDNPTKMACRAGNLRVLRETAARVEVEAMILGKRPVT